MTATAYAAILSTFLVMVCSTIALIDWRRMIIPNELNLLLLAGGIFHALLDPGRPLLYALLGGLAGGLFAFLVRDFYFRWRGVEGLGLGDVKFVAAGGVWLGMDQIYLFVFMATLLALVFVTAHAIVHGLPKRLERLPFAPFLCISLLLNVVPALMTGRSAIDRILSAIGI